jgi:predicted RNA methylase
MGIVLNFFLKIGSNSEIVFSANTVFINTATVKYNLKSEDIKEIRIIESTGFRGPFDIIFNLVDEDKDVKFQVEKFQFQNPKKLSKKLRRLGVWKDLIT